jgi:hypothetical protein
MIPEIAASKVAGFIGLHPYQKQDEIFYDMLCKNKLIQARIEDIQKHYNRKPINKALGEVLRDNEVQHCIKTGLQACKTTENVQDVLIDTQSKAEVVLNLRYSTFPPEFRTFLAQEIAGKVSCQRGNQHEAGILNDFEATRSVKVTERNAKMYRKDFGRYCLIGKIDGYVATENKVVDSKARTRFWETVPLYDEIQMRVYMRLVGAKEAELIERFPDGTGRTTKYANDEDKWTSLETALDKNVQRLNDILSSPEELKRIVFANTISLQNDG